MKITVEPIEKSNLEALPASLAFGRHFTDRMFSQRYSGEEGWHDARIGPYRPITLDPGAMVLHYGQEIFEGLKAYRRPDGKINLFRPWENALRFNRSAERMAMPPIDPEDHLQAIVELVGLERAWAPERDGASLYIRPAMIATDVNLSVHASETYLHYIILSPVGPYFASGFKPVGVYVSREQIRAARGGTGEAKTGGNYAASLRAGEEAAALGYQQVLWLDAAERRYVEEVGGMNIAFVYDGSPEGGHIVTPALSGSILAGITRDSVLRMAPDLGYTVAEERIELEQALSDIRAGRISEVFGIGTAAVIAPVNRLGDGRMEVSVGDNGAGPVASKLYRTLTDIQYGRAEDPYGWTYTIE